ncbi:MAG TPA: HAD family hydrolase [bacterium]|nr:HAD family hydrolase [bacterium]
MTEPEGPGRTASPALIFDLDGTLVDSVYQHVLAWHEGLQSVGIDLSVWRIHRRIGMSGGLFLRALAREIGRELADETLTRVRTIHHTAFVRQIGSVRPLRGARELLTTLTAARIPWAIATSGSAETARPTLELLAVPKDVPVITRDQVAYAKPNPDLFLAAAARLSVPITAAMVIGDSIWDLLAAHRAGTLGTGLLSGGYGREELESAGAYRVYEDPADLLSHLDELGVREVG